MTRPMTQVAFFPLARLTYHDLKGPMSGAKRTNAVAPLLATSRYDMRVSSVPT